MVNQGEIQSRITTIANRIRLARDRAKKPCVLLLGAGASLDSGVPTTDEIVGQILKTYGDQEIRGSTRDRFDEVWTTFDANKRDLVLQDFLDKEPSLGYQRLAALIQQDYFMRIITVNFDRLLVKALRNRGLEEDKHFGVVTNTNITIDQQHDPVVQAMRKTLPPVKVLELHAGLARQGMLLFTQNEMRSYPPGVGSLVREITENDIIIVGYSFKDFALQTSFAGTGGNIYCVNPEGLPADLMLVAKTRNSTGFVIEGKYGHFDIFFDELYNQLTKPQDDTLLKPARNPFKFLENYGPNDRDGFYGRKKERKKVMEMMFGEKPAKVIHLLGPPKAGKTSFIRARLIPHFTEQRVRSIYLRYPELSKATLEKWLPGALRGPMRRPTDDQPPASLEDTIRKLASDANGESKQVVLVLDDFDRLLPLYAGTEDGPENLLQSLNKLAETNNVSFICAGGGKKAEGEDKYLMAILHTKQDEIDLNPLKPRTMGAIVRLLGKRAGIKFEREVIREIMSLYETPKDKRQPFTMAHVHALCHILADRKRVDMFHYEKVMRYQGEALTAALNVKEFFSLLEDIPDEGRNLLRNVIKFIEGNSKRHLAECVQDHSEELLAA